MFDPRHAWRGWRLDACAGSSRSGSRMALRARKIAFVGSLALVAAARAPSRWAPERGRRRERLQALREGHAARAQQAPGADGGSLPAEPKAREPRSAPLGKSGRLKKAAQRHTATCRTTAASPTSAPASRRSSPGSRGSTTSSAGCAAGPTARTSPTAAATSATPKAIVRAWMRSPGHRHNILNPDFREIGIGFSRGTPSNPGASGSTITTDFGMRKR